MFVFVLEKGAVLCQLVEIFSFSDYGSSCAVVDDIKYIGVAEVPYYVTISGGCISKQLFI